MISWVWCGHLRFVVGLVSSGSTLLRETLFRAADRARKQDPQLAKIYYTQIVDRGADHRKALCIVAGHLAERPGP